MRNFLILLVCLISSQYTASASEDWKINVGGVVRDIIVTAPSGLNKPALVIVMHGMNGWHKGHQESTKFDQVAEREKFVVVYPNGIDGAWDISGNRDINFIEAIIDTMAQRYDVDRSRVYCTGWSMGGMMSYHLACNIPEKIAAIGPTSGYSMWGAPKCDNSRKDSDSIIISAILLMPLYLLRNLTDLSYSLYRSRRDIEAILPQFCHYRKL